MVASPRDVVELVRRMIAGQGVVFADLFADDGVLEYPFAFPGQPPRLHGREAIRAHTSGPGSRAAFEMAGVEAHVRETDDPEVVIARLEHHGRSTITAAPYRYHSLAIIRVRNGLIVSYLDYIDALATAHLLGRTSELAAAMTST